MLIEIKLTYYQGLENDKAFKACDDIVAYATSELEITPKDTKLLLNPIKINEHGRLSSENKICCGTRQ